MYTDDMSQYRAAQTQPVSGPCSRSSTPTCRCPYTIQSMLSVQHSIGRTMAAEVGYIRTDGNDFPLQRQFTQAFDRADWARGRIRRSVRRAATTSTAARRWTTTDCRRRCESASRIRYSWDVNYTLGKSESHAGRRPVGVLHRRVREQPGLLGSRIRPWAVQQRHPASAQRVVHLRAAAIRRRASRTPCSAAGRSPASSRRDRGMRYWSRSRRESTEAGLMSSTAWI